MAYLPDAILPSNQRGAYKNITNSVVRVDHATETAMQSLIYDYQRLINDPNFSDVEVIAAFIVMFLAIHPFRDGNGRMSRLLTDLCLLRQGYNFCMYSSHEKVIEDSKEHYLCCTPSDTGDAASYTGY